MHMTNNLQNSHYTCHNIVNNHSAFSNRIRANNEICPLPYINIQTQKLSDIIWTCLRNVMSAVCSGTEGFCAPPPPRDTSAINYGSYLPWDTSLFKVLRSFRGLFNINLAGD